VLALVTWFCVKLRKTIAHRWSITGVCKLREGFCFSCLLLLVLTFVFFHEVLHLVKSQSARQVARATELEGANASLRVELEAARSKLAEVERCGGTLTSENEGLKKDLVDERSAHETE
jgi:hypothetical protein